MVWCDHAKANNFFFSILLDSRWCEREVNGFKEALFGWNWNQMWSFSLIAVMSVGQSYPINVINKLDDWDLTSEMNVQNSNKHHHERFLCSFLYIFFSWVDYVCALLDVILSIILLLKLEVNYEWDWSTLNFVEQYKCLAITSFFLSLILKKHDVFSFLLQK